MNNMTRYSIVFRTSGIRISQMHLHWFQNKVYRMMFTAFVFSKSSYSQVSLMYTENRVKYNAYKNLFTSHQAKSLKRNYLSNKLEQAKNNFERNLEIIKDVMNKKLLIFLFLIPSNIRKLSIIKDPGEIGNKFNEFFVTM